MFYQNSLLHRKFAIFLKVEDLRQIAELDQKNRKALKCIVVGTSRIKFGEEDDEKKFRFRSVVC
ncbi:MAG: hypothetical protein Tsb0021_01530 [Chlamydiales bacterium]